MDEVRDVGPERLVAVAQLDGGSRLSACTSSQNWPIRSGELAVAAFGMHLALELVEAIWRTTVLIMSSTFWASIALRSRRSRVWSSNERKVSISPNTEAVSASVSGVDAISGPRAPASTTMHAVAELVGKRHHVARLAHIVEQNVGMHRRHRRVGERAGRLAGLTGRRSSCGRRVRAISAISGEALVGRQHGVLGVFHSIVACGVSGGARCDPSGSSTPCRASAPSSHSSGATGADRLRERRRQAHPRRCARRGWRGGASRRCRRSRASGRRFPCPGDVLVIRVKVRRFFLNTGQRRRLAPDLRVGVLQPVEVGSSVSSVPSSEKRRSVIVSSNRRFRRRGGDGLLVEQLLDAVLELVGLVLAQVEHRGR